MVVGTLHLGLERGGQHALERLRRRAARGVVDLARQAVLAAIEAVRLARDAFGERWTRVELDRLGLLPRHLVDGLEDWLNGLHARRVGAGREEGDVHGRLGAVGVDAQDDRCVDADRGLDRVPVRVLERDLGEWRGRRADDVADVLVAHQLRRVDRGEEALERHGRRARHAVHVRSIDRGSLS